MPIRPFVDSNKNSDMGSHFEFHTPLCVLRIIGSCRLAIRVMYGLDLTKMLAESEFVNYSYTCFLRA